MPRSAPVIALLLAAGLGAAAEPTPSSAMDRVKADLFFLAGDECEGRGLETDGIQKAGRHIATVFREAGLKPAGTDGYFQPFPVFTGKAERGPTQTLTFTQADGPAVKPDLDKEFTPLAGKGPVTGRLAFVGYGISAPALKYDDYAGIDVAGKWVVMFRRTPRAEDKEKPFDPAPDSPYSSLSYKLQQAATRKAAGVIFVNDASYGKGSDAPIEAGVLPATDLPVVQIKRGVLNNLLPAGTALADIETGIDADTKPNSFSLDRWTVAADVTFTRASLTTRNVVGVLPGSGPLADETVVVGAHYDHLGRGETGSMIGARGKGQVHFGADDNASGTTGLMELARRLGAVKNRVGRRVVFIAFSGEERGLFGSLHYCKAPTFPLDKTVFMLNMDMIGRASPAPDAPADGPKADRLVVYGTGTGTGLDAATDLFNARIGFNVIKVPTGSGPSDHESFFLKRVPVLFLFTGTHRDYHTPTDTPDKINLAGLLKAVDFAELLATHFAGVLERPKFEATKGGWYDPTEAKGPRKSGRTAGGPKLGIMPGNYEAEDGGVLVEDVTPGGAAEAAGLKKGDRVVGLAGKPVKNIEGYMAAMAAQKPGVEIEVVVIRKDKKETIKVTPK